MTPREVDCSWMDGQMAGRTGCRGKKGSHGGEWPEDIKSDDRTLHPPPQDWSCKAVSYCTLLLSIHIPQPSSLSPRTEQKYYTLLKSLNVHIKPTASNYNAKGNLTRKNKCNKIMLSNSNLGWVRTTEERGILLNRTSWNQLGRIPTTPCLQLLSFWKVELLFIFSSFVFASVCQCHLLIYKILTSPDYGPLTSVL